MTHRLLPISITINCQQTAGFLKKKKYIICEYTFDQQIEVKLLKFLKNTHIIIFHNMVKKLITLRNDYYFSII